MDSFCSHVVMKLKDYLPIDYFLFCDKYIGLYMLLESVWVATVVGYVRLAEPSVEYQSSLSV